MMTPLARLAGLALLAWALAGCSASSAESAVATAERDVAAIRDEASKIAPDRLQMLTDSLAAARERVAAGEHRSALMSARSISAMARDLRATMGTTKSQLENAFQSASQEVPASLERVLARIDELSRQRRLPPTIDAARFGTLRTEAANWNAVWAEAQQDFNAGNTAVAMQKANDLRTRLRNARSVLGMES